jgi:hypothetical protein
MIHCKFIKTALIAAIALGTVLSLSLTGCGGHSDNSHGGRDVSLTDLASVTDVVADTPDLAVTQAIFATQGVTMTPFTIDGETRYVAAKDGESWECLGEGHKILGTKETDNGMDIYALCSAYGYGFRDGRLVDEYGFGKVPTLLQFETDPATGGYVCTHYEEALDGSDYEDSVYRMFPRDVAKQALKDTADDSVGEEIDKQIRAYAEAYLKYLGRDAKISSYYEENFKILTDYGVSVEVSNALTERHGEYSIYVGQFERLENGERFVYEQRWEQEGDTKGKGVVTFRKSRYDDGKTVEEIAYQVDGDRFERVS